MDIIPRPKSVNFIDFIPENSSPQTKYGLPANVQYCRKCVITNQRPNSAVEYDHVPNSKKKTIFFDENGICNYYYEYLKAEKNNCLDGEVGLQK